MIYYLLYNIAVFSALILGLPYFLVRMATTRRFREGLCERLGFYPAGLLRRVEQGSIWVQAASVGEVNAARPLIGLLGEHFPSSPVILTCQTATGRQTARKNLGGEVAAILSPSISGRLSGG